MGMGLVCFIAVSGNYAIIKELLTKVGGAKVASEVPRSCQDTVCNFFLFSKKMHFYQ